MSQEDIRFILDESDGRFVLTEGEEDEGPEAPAAAKSEEDGDDSKAEDTEKSFNSFKEGRLQLLKGIATKAETLQTALVASLKPKDGQKLSDAAKEHEKALPAAKSVEKKLGEIVAKAGDIQADLDKITFAEKNRAELEKAYAGTAEMGNNHIDAELRVREFDSLESIDINSQESLTAAGSACDKVLSALDSFDEKVVKPLGDSALRAVDTADKNIEKQANDKESRLKAAIAVLTNKNGQTITLPKGVDRITKNSAFAQEVDKLGSKPTLNPFLNFLCRLRDNHDDVWKIIDFGQYAVIHNGYAAGYDKLIGKQELLTGVKKGLNDDLINKVAFYRLPYSDMTAYLKLQDSLAKAIGKEILEPDAIEDELGYSSGALEDGMIDAALCDKILWEEKDTKLRRLKDAENIAATVTGEDFHKNRLPTLSTDADDVTKSLAKTIGCDVKELPNHKKELTCAVRIVTTNAYLKTEIEKIEYDSAKQALTALGISDVGKELQITYRTQEDDKRWIKLFNVANPNYKTLLDAYLSAIIKIAGGNGAAAGGEANK